MQDCPSKPSDLGEPHTCGSMVPPRGFPQVSPPGGGRWGTAIALAALLLEMWSSLFTDSPHTEQENSSVGSCCGPNYTETCKGSVWDCARWRHKPNFNSTSVYRTMCQAFDYPNGLDSKQVISGKHVLLKACNISQIPQMTSQNWVFGENSLINYRSTEC